MASEVCFDCGNVAPKPAWPCKHRATTVMSSSFVLKHFEPLHNFGIKPKSNLESNLKCLWPVGGASGAFWFYFFIARVATSFLRLDFVLETFVGGGGDVFLDSLFDENFRLLNVD